MKYLLDLWNILNGKEKKSISLKFMDQWPMRSEKSKPNKGKMLSQQMYYVLKGFKANEEARLDSYEFYLMELFMRGNFLLFFL